MEERQMELFRDFVIDKVSVELPADNLSKLLRVGVFTTKQMCEGFLTITVSHPTPNKGIFLDQLWTVGEPVRRGNI